MQNTHKEHLSINKIDLTSANKLNFHIAFIKVQASFKVSELYCEG